jgi:hypothetical protein
MDLVRFAAAVRGNPDKEISMIKITCPYSFLAKGRITLQASLWECVSRDKRRTRKEQDCKQ